jgi:hypothetical protein
MSFHSERICAFYSVTCDEPDRDWFSEHMDRADRRDMDLLRDGGNCDVAISSPFEMAENCNSTGYSRALAAIVGSCEGVATLPGSRDLFAMAEFRASGQVPPSENENEPIKYCQ